METDCTLIGDIESEDKVSRRQLFLVHRKTRRRREASINDINSRFSLQMSSFNKKRRDTNNIAQARRSKLHEKKKKKQSSEIELSSCQANSRRMNHNKRPLKALESAKVNGSKMQLLLLLFLVILLSGSSLLISTSAAHAAWTQDELDEAKHEELGSPGSGHALSLQATSQTTMESLLGEPVELTCQTQGLAWNSWVRWDAAGVAYKLNTRKGLLAVEAEDGNYRLIDAPLKSSSNNNVTSSKPDQSRASILRIERVNMNHNTQFSCNEEPKIELRVFKVPQRMHLVAYEQRAQESSSSPQNSIQQIQISLDDSSSAAQAAAASQVPKLTVLLGTRLKLHCSSDEASPAPQIIWQDSNGNELNQPVQGGEQDEDRAKLAGFEFEQLTWPHERSPLHQASSSMLFRVQHQHDRQQFTCLAQNPAFERAHRWPALFGKQPSRSVQLEVVYPPEITLKSHHLDQDSSQSVDRANPIEGEPYAFQCELLRAYPEDVAFAWFVDDELVANATEPVLAIEAMPRYLRSIRCQATNGAGSSSASLKPDIRYAPAYVGHLLANQQQQPTSSRFRNQQHEQLAIGFDLGDTFNISCAFEANPRLGERVAWFKVTTNYADMRQVTPDEADELVERGLSQFVARSSGRLAINYQAMSEFWNQEIVDEELRLRSQVAKSAASISATVPNQPYHMNNEMQQQIDMPTMEKLPSGSGPEPWLNMSLPAEPLAWVYQNNQNSKSRLNTTENQIDAPTGKLVFVSKELSKRRHPNSTSQASRQAAGKRSALVTMSRYEIKQANEDSMGHYVCQARGQSLADQSVRQQASRSIYLVARKKPRIVSVASQFASLGLQREIRVDCLIQVNTVNASSNQVTWSKDNKPFVVEHERFAGDLNQAHKIVQLASRGGGKNISIVEQYSPDLLFLRSQLRIEAADLTDFGHYNCAINNSLGADSLLINFQYRTQTGFFMDAVAALSIAMAVIFFSVVCFLVVYWPRAAYLGSPKKQQSTSFEHHNKSLKMLDQDTKAKTTTTLQLQHQSSKEQQFTDDCCKSSSGNSSEETDLDRAERAPASNQNTSMTNQAHSDSTKPAQQELADTSVELVGNSSSAGLLQRLCARFGLQSNQDKQHSGSRTSLVSASSKNKPTISLPMCLTSLGGDGKILGNQQPMMSVNLTHQFDSGAGSDATTATTANGTNESSRSSSSAGATATNANNPTNNNSEIRYQEPVAAATVYQPTYQQQQPLYNQPACWPMVSQHQSAYDSIYATNHIDTSSSHSPQYVHFHASNPSSTIMQQQQYQNPRQMSQYSPPVPAKPALIQQAASSGNHWLVTTTASHLPTGGAYQTLGYNHHPRATLQTSPTMASLLRQAYPTMSPAAAGGHYVTLPARPASTAHCYHQAAPPPGDYLQNNPLPNDNIYQTNYGNNKEQTTDLYGQTTNQHFINDNNNNNEPAYSTSVAPSSGFVDPNHNAPAAPLVDNYSTHQHLDTFTTYNNQNSTTTCQSSNSSGSQPVINGPGKLAQQQAQLNQTHSQQAHLDLSNIHLLQHQLMEQLQRRQSSLTSLSQSSSLATNQTEPTINNDKQQQALESKVQLKQHPFVQQHHSPSGGRQVPNSTGSSDANSASSSSQISPTSMTTNHDAIEDHSAAAGRSQTIVHEQLAANIGTHV